MTIKIQAYDPDGVREMQWVAGVVHDAERDYLAKQQEQPRPATSVTSGGASVSFQDAQVTTKTNRQTVVNIEPQLKPGMVKVSDGSSVMTMTADAAKAAGLLDKVVEANAEGFKKGPEAANFASPEAAAEDKALAGVSESEKAQIEQAGTALDLANEALGRTAVNAIQHDVANSGLLPDASELPPGITSEMVSSVAAGFVAQANVVMKDTGADVNTLLATLTDDELKDARLATLRGNDARLKSLGSLAVQRLNSIPDDPTLLKELTANWPDHIQVVKRDDGWWVESKTLGQKVKWSEAVANGRLKVL